jgi:hypothetical protein
MRLHRWDAIMPRSILTEKLSRRGYHLSREYGVDPLELVTVSEVMTEFPPGDEVKVGKSDHLPESYVFSDETCRAVAEEMATSGLMNLLVVDRTTNRLLGSVGAAELLAGRRRAVRRESERSFAFQIDSPSPRKSSATFLVTHPLDRLKPREQRAGRRPSTP